MTKLKKTRVAITGNIGSGKSTFVQFVSELGYPVLLADDIAKEILVSDPDARSEIIKNFGAQSFQGSKVNNKFLADSVFSDSKKLQKINSILHPRVRKRIESLSEEYFKTKDILFVEAALIFESKIEKMYDYVVLIIADRELRMTRTTKAKKLTQEEFEKRDDSQMKEEIKKKKADFIFTNNGSKEELKQKAVLLIKLIDSTP